MEEVSYYDLLSVPKNATSNEIRQAFRRKALENHPDRGGDPELFQTINKACRACARAPRAGAR